MKVSYPITTHHPLKNNSFMDIAQQKKYLEDQLKNRGYNHNNLRYSIFPNDDSRSEYEIQIKHFGDHQYQVITFEDRGSLGAEDTYNDFQAAGTDFLKRLDATVRYNKSISSDPTLGQLYPSPLWDK